MFEIISDIFPVLNILILLFEKITKVIKFAFAKKSIVELLFENDKNNNNHNTKIRHKFVGRNINYNESMNNFKDKLEVHNFKNINDIYKLNNNYNNNNHEIKDMEIFNSKKIAKDSNKSLDKSGISLHTLYSKKELKINRNSFVTSQKGKGKRKRNTFPVFYYFLDVFIDKLESPKSFCCLDKKYLIVYNFVGKIFNISSYILLFKYFNLYKNILLKDSKKINIININKKININDKDIMETIEKNAFDNTFDKDENLYNTLIT